MCAPGRGQEAHHVRPRKGGWCAPPGSRGGARLHTCGGRGRGGAAADPAHPAEARAPRRNPAAGPERPAARRRQWERRWRRGPWSPGPGGDGRPRHEPRCRAPPCAARGPRREASASPGPRPGAGDALPGLRMMVDCQVSATPGLTALPGVAGGGKTACTPPHPIRRGGSTAPRPRSARAYAVPRSTPPGTIGKLRPGERQGLLTRRAASGGVGRVPASEASLNASHGVSFGNKSP